MSLEQVAEALALIAAAMENDVDEFDLGSDWHERARRLLSPPMAEINEDNLEDALLWAARGFPDNA